MYSIKKVSEMLDIPAVTIRAWEQRYGIISPIRSEGGHRYYTQHDIDTLSWIKNQMFIKNIKISEAIRMYKHRDLSDPFDDGLKDSYMKTYDDFMVRLYEKLVDLNTIQAHEMIDLAFSLYNDHTVFHEIFVPLLYRLGTDWETGRITVAQEHFSSQLIMQRCSQFLRVLPVQEGAPRVLAFCPEGELHHMGLMLFSLFLRKKGLDVIYLGENTPLNELSRLISKNNISIVAISLTDSNQKERLYSWIKECTKMNPKVSIILGGCGFQENPSLMSAVLLSGNQKDWEGWYNLNLRRSSSTR